jgi:hypothetical protein
LKQSFKSTIEKIPINLRELVRLLSTNEFPFDRLARFYDFGDINRAVGDAKQERW